MLNLSAPALSLLPPLIVLTLGILTRRVLFSLACGLLSAALLATKASISASATLLTTRLWQNIDLTALHSWDTLSQSQPLLVFFFLTLLGIMVTLLEHSGGAAAYATAIRKRLRSARQVERTSMLLSTCFFIDDYFSSLTVGTIMRPLTDHFKIPRVKLAFLVDSLAAPISILVPVSSWVAVIISQLQKVGIGAPELSTTTIIGDPFIGYLHSIPFIAYSFTLIFATWLIVQRRISFGPMREHEVIARTTGNTFGGRRPRLRALKLNIPENANPSLFDFAIPMGLVLSCVGIGLLWTGGHTWFGGNNDLVTALRTANSFLALAGGIGMAFAGSVLFLRLRNVILLSQLPALAHHGFLLMAPAMLILWLCWTFGDLLCKDLHTGTYLAQVLVGAIPLWLLPLLFFIVASMISFAMGSSWGTVAITIPIAVPMLLSLSGITQPVPLADVALFAPIIGAILSGAVLGDHISPISDTTVMSATSTGSYHIDHVYTQFVYVVPVFIGACVSFVLAGLTCTWGLTTSSLISILGGIAVVTALLLVLDKADAHTTPQSHGEQE